MTLINSVNRKWNWWRLHEELSLLYQHNWRPLQVMSVVRVTGHMCSHLATHDGFEGDAGDQVRPDDVQHLQHEQQDVEEPPGRVRPNDAPALEHGCVQYPTCERGRGNSLQIEIMHTTHTHTHTHFLYGLFFF